MDYSEFVRAVKQNDRDTLNELVPVIRKVLHKFLLVRFNARSQDADDVVQNTLLQVYLKIRADRIRHPDQIIHYMFATARNQFLNLHTRVREPVFDELPVSYVAEPDQLTHLLTEEKQALLKECLDSLRPQLREFILYWFLYPGCDAQTVADTFGISVNNAWTKKHRILQLLQQCVKKKLEQ